VLTLPLLGALSSSQNVVKGRAIPAQQSHTIKAVL
jgi:hypothetical protein